MSSGTSASRARSGSGGAITQVADNDTGSSLLGFNGTPSINAANQVAFHASLGASTMGIFRGDGGPLTTIATTSPGGFGGLGEKPAINSSGNVARPFQSMCPATEKVSSRFPTPP